MVKKTGDFTFGYVTIIRIKVILTINRMTIIIKTEITKIVVCRQFFLYFFNPKIPLTDFVSMSLSKSL